VTKDGASRAAGSGERAEWLSAALGLREGETPFPWQQTLLDGFISGERWRAIDIPTGLGKTAVMAIWLVARARGAKLPRRLVYVVDRRAVVDQATDVAIELRNFVDRNEEVRRALGVEGLLPISTLRGQLADNREWLVDPSSPAIIVGTIDMIGSRLLFEGYGASRRMRPYHAGLLGADTLVVLDEAHLVPPFEALLEALAATEAKSPVPPLQFISLSATGRDAQQTFRLTPADLRHPGVDRRLRAAKRLMLRDRIEPSTLVERLTSEAWALSGDGQRAARCIVFCDSRDIARRVHEALTKLAPDPGAVELFVGARRVHERVEAADWLRNHGFLAGHRTTPPCATFLVATSAGEVGVDLDADHAVCDVVAWERMVQRLGRVNRRGDGDAIVVVVPTSPDKATLDGLEKAVKLDRSASAATDEGDDDADKPAKKLKPEELGRVRRHRRMEATRAVVHDLPSRADGYDASPGAFRALKERAQDDPALATRIREASTPAPLHPALTRQLVDAWSMTSLVEHTGRPEILPWVRGWIEEDPQTTLLWRTHLPVRWDGEPLRRRELAMFFEGAASHLTERLEADTSDIVAWLEKRLDALEKKEREPAKRDEASREDEDTVEAVLGEPRPLKSSEIVAFAITRDAVQPVRGSDLKRKGARENLERRLAGGTLVVDVRLGGLTAGLLDEHSDTASDVSEVRALPFRVRTARAPDSIDDQWREELALEVELNAEGDGERWLIVESGRDEQATTEEGRSVATRTEQSLERHQSWAERHARVIAGRLSLSPAHVDLLALAARLHDEGKRAERWQRAFGAPRKGGPYAKTRHVPNVHLLDGYRHELGSLPIALRDSAVAALDPSSRDLCLHLIAAHHGHARPVIETRGCEDAPPSALDERAQDILLRFVRLQTEWGPWGLAWWEALLRAADQTASRELEEKGDAGG
jgi:CRISPR-associated endonuclease/helicase Cas3